MWLDFIPTWVQWPLLIVVAILLLSFYDMTMPRKDDYDDEA
jgi:hypothetical protein